jgi:putative peptidoglycan lipid II flippase
VVLLPQLSSLRAADDAQAYSDLLDWGLRLVVLLALPCAVALVVFARPLVAVVYHYGAFTAHDVQQTMHALMGYGAGLLGLIGVKVLAPGFYARQDIRTPVRIAIAVLVVTQAMNGLFVPYLAHAGLTLSIGLGALINAGWLLLGLRRRGMYRPSPGWRLYLLRVTLAAALMGAAMLWAATAVDWLALHATPGLRIGWLALALATAALIYFGTLLASGLRPRHLERQG